MKQIFHCMSIELCWVLVLLCQLIDGVDFCELSRYILSKFSNQSSVISSLALVRHWKNKVMNKNSDCEVETYQCQKGVSALDAMAWSIHWLRPSLLLLSLIVLEFSSFSSYMTGNRVGWFLISQKMEVTKTWENNKVADKKDDV